MPLSEHEQECSMPSRRPSTRTIPSSPQVSMRPGSGAVAPSFRSSVRRRSGGAGGGCHRQPEPDGRRRGGERLGIRDHGDRRRAVPLRATRRWRVDGRRQEVPAHLEPVVRADGRTVPAPLRRPAAAHDSKPMRAASRARDVQHCPSVRFGRRPKVPSWLRSVQSTAPAAGAMPLDGLASRRPRATTDRASTTSAPGTSRSDRSRQHLVDEPPRSHPLEAVRYCPHPRGQVSWRRGARTRCLDPYHCRSAVITTVRS